MKPSRSYRDLIVWQKSMDLVSKIYNFTQSFPKEEMYGITSQMRRAGISVPANIAEGQGRNSKGEFLQFLGIAQGSLAELETLILICQNLAYIQQNNAEELLNDCEEIGRLLAALKRSLRT
ncbi:MAG TPA: four helix bundle protein [Thermodesulfovibrionia bacterium]|nr:four helix bundle protein [Thermodesulfovibrionia bacterium]